MDSTRHGLHLPADLVSFLASGKQLEYDPAACEAGAITLLPLSDLKLQRFPVETGSLDVFEQDPHYPKRNSYLVLGVDLVASATGGYDPEALLMWLPVEGRYGIWDSSHCGIRMFGADVTWERSRPTRFRTSTPAGRVSTRKPRRWKTWCRGRITPTGIAKCTGRNPCEHGGGRRPKVGSPALPKTKPPAGD